MIVASKEDPTERNAKMEQLLKLQHARAAAKCVLATLLEILRAFPKHPDEA